MFDDAHDELERMPTKFKTHPEILHARLILLVEMGRWEEGVILGNSLIRIWPDYTEFYIKTAYCLHEEKRTLEAKSILLDGPESLHRHAVFHYNLACYEAQLGNFSDAKEQLKECFTIDMDLRTDALEDSDLEPLWDWLKD